LPCKKKGKRRGVRREDFTVKIVDENIPRKNRRIYNEMKLTLRKAGIRYTVSKKGEIYVLPKNGWKAIIFMEPFYNMLKIPI